MTIYRYEMTIPVKVVSALHSGGVDKAPEREYVDEDGRTAQPNEAWAKQSCPAGPSRARCVLPSRSTPLRWGSRIPVAESTSRP